MDRYAQPVFIAEAESAAEASRWADALKGQPWVTAVSVDGERIRITVKDIQLARRELLPSAVEHRLVLRRYEETRPSLEDVFMQLTEEVAK